MVKSPRAVVATFSIVAIDPETKDLGIAVQSKFLSVGSVVPWASAGVGAVATQSYANSSFGPRGLDMMKKGLSAEETMKKLISADRGRDNRQVGIVDGKGRSATYTGSKCMEWAGGVVGDGFAAQGNILVDGRTVESMASTFENSKEDFPERLLAALQAGQDAGGDRRGMQSAALLVVRKKGGYGGFNDRYIDLRVDDHESPIAELRRIFRIYDLVILSRERKEDLLRIDNGICRQLQSRLKKLGYYSGPVNGSWGKGISSSLEEYLSVNNFENKKAPKGHIWKSVLDYIGNDSKRKS